MLCSACGADAGEASKFCPSCGATVVRATPAPAGDELVGRTLLGKYRVEALIGEGGMGKVYRAKQLSLDKLVVLKLLRPSLLSDTRTVQRFQREAKAASRLNHPNSISVLDFGQLEDSALYIAMEFVAGKDLHHILTREWPLPESRVIRIMGQVLSALADAHGAGVIHRDLKPENIMVEQRRDQPDFVKVLDFGIAKIQDSTGDDGPALTRAGFVCGTPEYMSPEQARGAPLDHRSDLYAVGVILYQLCTGVLPFESESAVGYATAHLMEEPPLPSMRRPEARVSPGMEDLILRALSKDPALRPQTAEAFRTELLAVGQLQEVTRRTGGLTRPGATQPLAAAATAPTEQGLPEAAQATLSGAPPFAPTQLQPRPADPAATRPAGRPLVASAQAPTEASLTAQHEAAARSGRGGLGLKLATGAVVLAALGVGGYALLGKDAPVPAAVTSAVASTPPQPAAERPLYERAAPEQPDVDRARQLARDGDVAHQQGRLEEAAAAYEKAFEAAPSAELSLKLGEVHWQRNATAEAHGWWKRHLGDHRDCSSLRYIQQAVPQLATATE